MSTDPNQEDLAVIIAQFFGPTDSPDDAARAVIAAGWVSPERHARTAAVAQRDEAEKGRLWQHLRDRCAAAETEVRGWRALRDRLEAAMDGDWHSGDELHDLITAALAAPEETP